MCVYIYIYSTNIPPIMIINRIYETQNLLYIDYIYVCIYMCVCVCVYMCVYIYV